MKLLLDENLSRRLLPLLESDYPGSTQVALVGLGRSNDLDLWDYARANGCVIVTKDDDFSALSALRGHPPRVIKLTLGNSDNAVILAALLSHRESIEERFADDAVALVELTATTLPPSA
jgi:predicted nuclease of predicted toxin-antitoxin system